MKRAPAWLRAGEGNDEGSTKQFTNQNFQDHSKTDLEGSSKSEQGDVTTAQEERE